MNKKKIIGIIIGIIIVLIGVITINYMINKNKITKPTNIVANNIKGISKVSKSSIDINLIPVEQQKIKNYKEETQNINGNKIKVMTGTYSFDPKTGYSWLGGKKIPTPQFTNCISSSDKSLFNLSRKENAKDVIIMILGKNMQPNILLSYEIIQYAGPYSASSNRPEDSNKYIQDFGKVVSSDNTGITLDNGKKYNISEAPFIQMMNNDRGLTKNEGITNKFLKSYDSKDFPKNTIVSITFKNGKINNVDRFCIIK